MTKKKPKEPPKQRNPFVRHIRFKRQGAHKKDTKKRKRTDYFKDWLDE